MAAGQSLLRRRLQIRRRLTELRLRQAGKGVADVQPHQLLGLVLVALADGADDRLVLGECDLRRPGSVLARNR